ncbi:hypothetical protein DVK02_06895 [Halobellus sp. Atlit-31R]|nr:hypothetical protein DVK02_06895 [Halobellus sp. Atlit-31R]
MSASRRDRDESTVVPGTEPVVTYARDTEDAGVEAVVSAFSAQPLDVDPADRGPIYEWIDLEAIDSLFDSARDDVRLSTIIWNHPVVLTTDRIEVYDPDRDED